LRKDIGAAQMLAPQALFSTVVERGFVLTEAIVTQRDEMSSISVARIHSMKTTSVEESSGKEVIVEGVVDEVAQLGGDIRVLGRMHCGSW
jgi:formate dehydrogenase assembly factor FdhD